MSELEREVAEQEEEEQPENVFENNMSEGSRKKEK